VRQFAKESIMAVVLHRASPVEWSNFPLADRWRRFFETDESDGWLPVEELRDGDTIIVRAEIPDVDPDKDVEITTADGLVRIHAHREQRIKHAEGSGYRSEFRYGEFTREIALPEGVDPKAVSATYRDGILEVRIPNPQKPAVAPTKVAISRG
jgi:HSP20 family protein